MKLGMINSAWEQHDVGLVDGLHRTKELGFDCVDIFQDPLDDNAGDRILVFVDDLAPFLRIETA